VREHYRKRGVAVRYENGVILRVAEEGVAIEDGDLFECYPEAPAGGRLARPDRASRPIALGRYDVAPGETPGAGGRDAGRPEDQVEDVARAIQHAARGVSIERLVITHGVAEHEYNGVRWSDETRRVHLSLVRGTTRVLVDRGDFHVDSIAAIAAALARAEGEEREAPPQLRLAPNVTAALLPSLAGITPPNVRLVQRAGGIDGRGQPIVATEPGEPWPNWYRPSYRVRPVRMPMNLVATCHVTEIDRSRPVAIALLAPVSGLTLRVLVDDGRRVFPARVRVARIDAIADEAEWYPYGAGSFGAELML
jgi:hypothetical protein